MLQAGASNQDPSSAIITVLERNSAGYATRAYGTAAAPSGTTTIPYANGCEYIKTDGSAGAIVYRNESTTATSPSFKAIHTAGTGAQSFGGNVAITGDLNVTGNSNTTGNTVLTGAVTMTAGGLLGNAAGINTNATGGGWIGGNAAQKAGLHGVAAVQYPANAAGLIVGATGNGATAAGTANIAANGNLGSTNYTLSDVVAMLKQKGAIAQ